MSHRPVCRFFLLLCLGCLSARAEPEYREFTSTDGQSIKAVVVNYDPGNGQVVIRREDGRKFTVPFDRFSADDQAYLTHWRDEYDRSFYSLDFMGIRAESSRIVFVIDESGSMNRGRWDKLIRTLKPVFDAMEPPLDFNIIVFGSYSTLYKEGGLIPATKRNVFDAYNWLQYRSPDGGTDTKDALDEAFAMKEVETIILLSDGYPAGGPDSVLYYVHDLQRLREKRVVIHTISYQSDQGAEFLKELAEQNGGRFARR